MWYVICACGLWFVVCVCGLCGMWWNILQGDILKTLRKSKWNSPTCSSNPQEAGKRKQKQKTEDTWEAHPCPPFPLHTWCMKAPPAGDHPSLVFWVSPASPHFTDFTISDLHLQTFCSTGSSPPGEKAGSFHPVSLPEYGLLLLREFAWSPCLSFLSFPNVIWSLTHHCTYSVPA